MTQFDEILKPVQAIATTVTNLAKDKQTVFMAVGALAGYSFATREKNQAALIGGAFGLLLEKFLFEQGQTSLQAPEELKRSAENES